jgi:GT2 family glycosyltransferase
MSEFARGLGLGFVQRRFPVLVSDMVKPGPVDWVSGAAMLTRWAAIEDLGGMDEDYFLYYEEIDFMKAVADAGWSTWHAPDARVLHIAGSSTGIVDGMPTDGRMPPYWFASWRRYFVKNHGTTYASIAAVMKIAGLVLGNIQSTIRGKGKKLPPKFLSDFIQAGLFGRTVAK